MFFWLQKEECPEKAHASTGRNMQTPPNRGLNHGLLAMRGEHWPLHCAVYMQSGVHITKKKKKPFSFQNLNNLFAFVTAKYGRNGTFRFFLSSCSQCFLDVGQGQYKLLLAWWGVCHPGTWKMSALFRVWLPSRKKKNQKKNWRYRQKCVLSLHKHVWILLPSHLSCSHLTAGKNQLHTL